MREVQTVLGTTERKCGETKESNEKNNILIVDLTNSRAIPSLNNSFVLKEKSAAHMLHFQREIILDTGNAFSRESMVDVVSILEGIVKKSCEN